MTEEVLKNTKRLLRTGERVKPGDEVWATGEFVEASEIGRAGGRVRDGDFVLRPAENEDLGSSLSLA